MVIKMKKILLALYGLILMMFLTLNVSASEQDIINIVKNKNIFCEYQWDGKTVYSDAGKKAVERFKTITITSQNNTTDGGKVQIKYSSASENVTLNRLTWSGIENDRLINKKEEWDIEFNDITVGAYYFNVEDYMRIYSENGGCPTKIAIADDWISGNKVALTDPTRYDADTDAFYISKDIKTEIKNENDCSRANATCVWKKIETNYIDNWVEIGYKDSNGKKSGYFAVWDASKKNMLGSEDVGAQTTGTANIPIEYPRAKVTFRIFDVDVIDGAIFNNLDKVKLEDKVMYEQRYIIITYNGSKYVEKEIKDSPSIEEYEKPIDNLFGNSSDNNKKDDIKYEALGINTDINLCKDKNTLKIFQIVGYVIYILKILVPLILIVMASVDVAKAVFNSSEKPNTDALKSIGKRIIIAVIIFLVPTILDFLLGLVGGAKDLITKDSGGLGVTTCQKCLLDPLGDTCQNNFD